MTGPCPVPAGSGSAREAVLGRIRDAHRLAPPPDLAYEAIARDYRRERPGTTEELVELLVDRLVDYKAHVRRTTPEGLAETIAAALTERGVRTVAVPPGEKREIASDDRVYLGAWTRLIVRRATEGEV